MYMYKKRACRPSADHAALFVLEREQICPRGIITGAQYRIVIMRGDFMPVYNYDAGAGAEYARIYALPGRVWDCKPLFYYDAQDDCTNFISQCVWAAYGGWIPGCGEQTQERNAQRILKDVRQTPGVWYGSASYIGSDIWCRVDRFHDYVVAPKTVGPAAWPVAEGRFTTVDPDVIELGDVIQLVVASYIPDRYGHSLYVTQTGRDWDDVLICCHSIDRLDAPMTTYSAFPQQYTSLRIMRFSPTQFYD